MAVRIEGKEYKEWTWATAEINLAMFKSKGIVNEDFGWTWVSKIPSPEQAEDLVRAAKGLDLEVRGPFGQGPWAVSFR
jgi:hypothetical protein